MRASAITISMAVLLTATPALARDRHKTKQAKQEQQVEEEKPAEPAADADTGWDQSAESVGKKPARDTSATSDSAEPSTSSENVAAIDAASESSAKDEQVASKEPPTWWFGAYLHGAWVPSFMLGLFLEGPPTIGNAAFGVTATHRNKDGFSFVMGLGYAGYGFEGPFHEKGKPDEDTEWVKSTLGLVHVTGAMLWSTDIVPELLSFEYGIGVDFGIITGQLERTEAYRTANGGYAPCTSYLKPAVTTAAGVPYCEVPQAVLNGNPAATTDAYDQTGAQYHVIEKRIPPVMLMPMLPLLTLRLTPVRNLAVKLEGAYGIFQFSFGISAAYGVDL